MATQVSLTVKKDDGTTDIVWTAVTPSPGDNTPAVWKSKTVNSAAAFQPELRISARSISRSGESKPTRSVRSTMRYPYVVQDSSTGLYMVAGYIQENREMSYSTDIPDSVIAEAVTQIANIYDEPSVKNSFKEGYAPT